MLPIKNVKIPLCVPYWDERRVLEEGAKYDEHFGFYVEEANHYLPNFRNWLPLGYDPEHNGPVVLPDMLPVTTWENNLRLQLSPEKWDTVRKYVYKAAGFRCEICGNRGKLEAHEKWDLINETQTQKLVKLLALCPTCHKIFHIGFARSSGMLPAVKAQIMRLNEWNSAQLEQSLIDCKEVWEQRCDWPWTLDLDWIHESGYLFAY